MSEQVFISYRREGGNVTAKLICEALKNCGYTVFYDYDSISGGYFDARILDAIEGCDDFVLVLPPHSLDRCVNEDDWVRQEIRCALKHKKNIIPVLLPGFAFPKDIPSDIADITRFSGVEFIMAYFEGVIEAIANRFTTTLVPSSPKVLPEKAASEGLAFELNENRNGYVVSIGKCTDVDIVIPRLHNGRPVTEIAEDAFKGYTSLVSIIIPSGVTSIGKGAFNGCVSLTSIAIPNSVTSIEKWAFQDCTALTRITIPKSVTKIGARVFLNCQSLVEIDVDPENNFFCSRNGHLYTKNLKTLVSYAVGCKESYYVIPDGVTRIEDSAFSRCTSITGIQIPQSVTSMGDFVCYCCDSLIDITIPTGVTSIGESAFCGCSELKNITLPDTMTSVGKWAFQDCTALARVEIPKSVTKIGARAFLNCQSLVEIAVDPDNNYYCSDNGHLYMKKPKALVSYAIGCKESSYVIPDGVTKIEDSAFSRCTSITSVQIPQSVTSIGNFSFYRCGSLTNLVIPNGVTSIGESAFSGCGALTSITLPNGLISIEKEAFRNCGSLTNITLPKGVTGIGESAFSGCGALTSITLPNGLTSIAKEAFRNCGSLAKITLPNGVTSIGRSAFNGCGSLRSITIPNSVTDIEKWAFDDCTALASVLIPKNVTNIEPRAFLNCKSLPKINVSFWNRSYRSVAGHLYTRDMKTLISYAIGCKETSYVIPNGVTRIEDSAFSRCTSIVNLTIPASVSSMGDYAMYNCTSLKNIHFKGTVEMWKEIHIGDACFKKAIATVIHCANGDVTL